MDIFWGVIILSTTSFKVIVSFMILQIKEKMSA